MSSLPWHEKHFEALIGERARLPHALLLHGPEGIGKSRFAGSLAQALLCESAGNSRPCEACAACGWFGSGNHPDFRLLEPAHPEENEQGEQQSASKARIRIVIEQIRELSEFINVSSHRGGFKVILIQPAEALNLNAANALLKSLEEPPAGTFFLLVTHRLHFLLPTLRSRCRHIALPVPQANTAAEWLRAQGVAQPELALAHTGNAPLLAHELAQRDYWPQRDLFLSRVAVRRFDALAAAEEIADFALRDIVTWLQKWTFDLVFQRCLGKVRYNPDRAGVIAELSGNIELLRMLRFHRELLKLQRVIDHPLNPRLLIEQVLLDYGSAVSSASGARA
ncbi:MAG TPA: DNA polymerase III subunit delta' [Burkholderiales bacterium]|nr:DNA polymerase III subunit delta' [Burkholderiales bacterium]